jgi:ribosomal protein L32
MPAGVVSLEDVAQFVSREATRRNGKIVPKLPGKLHEMCTKAHYYIFNVGPWMWDRQLGGRGTRVLQPCPEGQAYGPALEMPFLDNETVASDMNKMENRQEDGIEVVNAFLQKGWGSRPEASLEHWGIGVSEQWPPTAQEVAAATKRLNSKFDELCHDADKFHEQREYANITEFHRLAARRRKLQKPWLNENPDLQACPACGSQVMPNIAVCPQCSATLNEELARKFFPERFKKSA